jgi:hypothetical protein
MMAKQTALEILIADKKFTEARELLEQMLLSGDLIDPRDDSLWAPIADRIAMAIQQELGLQTVLCFWEELTDFFIKRIEPIWGHAHKGHLYFRIGFAAARQDFAKARAAFETAYQEDIQLAILLGAAPAEAPQRASNSSAYVALVILERIDDVDFASGKEKEQFLDRLFGPSFDAAIRNQIENPESINKAITAIVPSECQPPCQALYDELQQVNARALPFATIWATGDVLESVLLGYLYYGRKITTVAGKDILKVELGPLYKEAERLAIFPSQSVAAACDLIYIFRNRIHPGNEMRQKYKLTQRTARTIKNLLDRALLEWQKALP